MRCQSRSSTHYPVVVRVGPDPNLGQPVAFLSAERAVVISDADGEAIFASLQTPETKRGMTRLAPPQAVVLDGEFLDFGTQRFELRPEPAGCDGGHACGGHSRRLPSAASLSASSKRKSSLPAAESESNC